MTCSCKKRQYPTRAQARHEIVRMKAHGRSVVSINRGRLRAYQCDGEVWHLGNSHLQGVVEFRRRRAA